MQGRTTTEEQIKVRRQQESVPLLEELHAWMKNQYQLLLPSAPMSEAIGYCLKHWERLCYYTQDGKLQPDNNAVENSIRPVALGRKNCLFAGSAKGAERITIIYSLTGTCRMNGINPIDWLTVIFSRINVHPINRIHELLPHNWIKDNPVPTPQ
jgi:transposase